MQSIGLANPLLTWEKIKIYNVGLDVSFFQRKLYSELDFFYRERSGIPATRIGSLPSTFGADLPPENLNSLSNRGFEFMLGTNGSSGDFRWDINGNVSWTRAKWIHYEEPEYTDPDQIRINQRSGNWTDRTFGYLSDGLFTSMEEIEALEFDQDKQNNASLRPGDIRYIDVNKDGELDWRDQVEIGRGTTPNWMYGLSINLLYKNMDFSSLFQGAAGYHNYIRATLGAVPFDIYYKERWTQENNNPNALIPRVGGSGMNTSTSDHWIKNAGYLRLKTLSIGYNFPLKMISNLKLSKLRIYVAGTNLLTFDKLKKYGTDPEAPSGFTGAYYPQQKTISVGTNISF